MKKINHTLFIFLMVMFVATYCFAEDFKTIKVKKGDTFRSLAKKYLKDASKWTVIAEMNDMDPSTKIRAGMLLKVPDTSTTVIKTISPKQSELSIDTQVQQQDTNLIEGTMEFKKISNDDISQPKSLETPYKEKKATITYIKGSVRLKNAIQGIWINLLKAGVPVYKGDILETDDNSTAMLSFEDGSYIKLMPGTSIKLIKTIYDKIENALSSSVEINGGVLECYIRPVSPIVSDFSINTKNIFAKGSGKFNVSVNKNDDFLVEVIDGKMDVTGSGRTATVTNDYGIFVAAGDIPGRAIKLLQPPKLISPPDKVYVKSSLPEFKYTDVDKAVKYKIQIAKDELFNVIVLEDNYITGNVFKSKALLDGYYYWRVAAVDVNGLTGKYSQTRVIKIDTTSPRLIITSPLEDEIIKNKIVRIKGVTEPGYPVQINQFTYYPDKKGNIDIELEFMPGTNVALFTMKDEAGNITTMYRTFHADFYNQISPINGKNYIMTDNWNVNIYNAKGQVIVNDRFYEVDFGKYTQQVSFVGGINHLILSLENIGYKDMQFIYDNDKPILKQVRISPIIKDEVAYLNVFVKAEDKTSELDKKAELVLEEYANISNRYFVDLNYSEALNEYQGVISVRPQVLNRELSIASIKVKDIAGNMTAINSGSFDRPTVAPDFWEKARTNYSMFKVQKGIPVFLLSAAGLLLLL